MLNSIGARQFRELEQRSWNQFVDVVWAGVSFGKRRLNLPIEPAATRLVLGSNWMNFDDAERIFDRLNEDLLHMKNLNSPCGMKSIDSPSLKRRATPGKGGRPTRRQGM